MKLKEYKLKTNETKIIIKKNKIKNYFCFYNLYIVNVSNFGIFIIRFYENDTPLCEVVFNRQPGLTEQNRIPLHIPFLKPETKLSVLLLTVENKEISIKFSIDITKVNKI